MLYIASPYTHAKADVRAARAHCVSVLTGQLMLRVKFDFFFSPIVQGHEVAYYLPEQVARDHDFWMKQCAKALAAADRLYLLPLPGWEESEGVQWELNECLATSKQVVYVDCRGWAAKYLRDTAKTLDYRSTAEREALRIWQQLAAGQHARAALESARRQRRGNWQLMPLEEV